MSSSSFSSRIRAASGDLARFDLAARKFPQARQRLALGALGEEDAAVGVDQGDGRDEDDLHQSSSAGHDR